MSDEHNVSSQSSMQCLATRLPIIILQRAEEQLLPVREVMVGAVCLCGDKIIILSYSGGFLWLKEQKIFLESCATFNFLLFQILRLISYICSVECTS
jgi:hypothetical protein